MPIHIYTYTYVCIYTYISRLYVYIYRFARVPCPLFTERFAFPPSRPNLGAVFPVAVFLFVPSFSPPASIPFVITEDESRVIGTRSFRVTISPSPFPRSTHPVLQLALRSVLLPHFAFKVRLSLPNNIILSLDTSPCEGGRRHDRRLPRSSRRVNPRREVFLFFFLSISYFSPFPLVQPIEYDFSRDRRHRSPNKPN